MCLLYIHTYDLFEDILLLHVNHSNESRSFRIGSVFRFCSAALAKHATQHSIVFTLEFNV